MKCIKDYVTYFITCNCKQEKHEMYKRTTLLTSLLVIVNKKNTKCIKDYVTYFITCNCKQEKHEMYKRLRYLLHYL